MTDKKDYYVPENSPVFPSRFDTRVRLRSLTLGLLKQEELDSHLEALPDESENAEFVDFNSIVEDDDTAAATQEAFSEPLANDVTDADVSFDSTLTNETLGTSESTPAAPAEANNETPKAEDLPVIPPVVPPSDGGSDFS